MCDEISVEESMRQLSAKVESWAAEARELARSAQADEPAIGSEEPATS